MKAGLAMPTAPRQVRFLWWFLCLGALTLAGLLSFLTGAASIDWQKLFTGDLLSPAPGDLNSWDAGRDIILNLRLPRLIVAALAGGAMATAGVISQTLFQNPLAGPSIMGTSSGGVFLAVVVIAAGWPGLLLPPLAAFVGCVISTLLILALCQTRVGRSRETLLLAGFAMNALWAALTTMAMSLVTQDWQKTPQLWDWIMGSFTGRGWEHLSMGAPFILLGLVGAWRLSRPMDLLTLGSEVATSLSLSVRRIEVMAILCMSLLVAGTVTLAGALPFVGLIVPHITRVITGPSCQRLLPLCFINGMTLVLLADWLARILAPPQELAAGALISLLGAPFFLGLLIKQSRRLAGGGTP